VTLALLREGVLAGALEHPNIVPVHAIGCDERGRPVLVMKRIEGVSWTTLLDDESHPAWQSLASEGTPLETHLEILSSVCNALHFAHQRGIVHRDVKPDNVMVGSFGEVYLVDWGIAARVGTVTHDPVGTPGLFAPEMVLAGAVDARTDVYLLGATLHEVLTGKPRHEGTNLNAVLYSAAVSAPVEYESSVPEELAALCNRATSADPANRPESALAFRRALAEHVRHRGAVRLCGEAERSLEQGDLDEARFGFRQALHDWPESKVARRGLSACLAKMIDGELLQGDFTGARALLAELPEPRPELEAQIVETEAVATRKALEHERLQAIARDNDPSIGRRSRVFGVVLSTAGLMALSVFTLVTRPQQRLVPIDLLYFVFGIIAVFVVVLAVLGKRVLGTAFNRKTVALIVVATTAMLANRVYGVVHAVPPEITLVHDMMLVSAVTAVGALTLGTWLVLPAASYAIGAAIAVALPERAALVFTIATIPPAVLTVFAWRAPKREAQQGSEL
jgi:serine/threonine-protein kinase